MVIPILLNEEGKQNFRIKKKTDCIDGDCENELVASEAQ